MEQEYSFYVYPTTSAKFQCGVYMWDPISMAHIKLLIPEVYLGYLPCLKLQILHSVYAMHQE